jgi:hypothetical protein
MQKARQIASACDVFYTRGKAVAWFNAVMAVLGLKPSVFLRLFGEFMRIRKGADINESELDDVEVWNLQRKFLLEMFDTSRLRRFQSLVLDLLDYHYHYAAALLAPQTAPTHSLKSGQKSYDFPLRRAPSLQMARFHYEILDIIEAGAPDIRWLINHLKPVGSYAAIYPRGDSVCTQSFDFSYYKLLDSLDGRTNACELTSKLGIPPEAASKFFRFAIQEGFVIL